MGDAIICKIDGCCNGVSVGGLCNSHYTRKLRYGDPLAGGPMRFFAKNCAIDGCARDAVGRGLCTKHYAKLKKYGDPLYQHPKHLCNERWIEDNKSYDGDDCLKWPFSVGDHGRGKIGRGEKCMSAPKAMCIAAHGAPPTDKHEAAHSCGNGHLGCMNPKHLRWATHKENEADKKEHGTLRQGTKINTNKLTEEEVLEIRSRKGKQSGVSLAKEFGVTPANISSILNGKNWKFLL